MCQNSETYILQENYGKVIGEITFKIKKAFDYDREQYPEDPSHVFVDELRNPNLKWRGSSNQRVIDVKKTIKKGDIVL